MSASRGLRNIINRKFYFGERRIFFENRLEIFQAKMSLSIAGRANPVAVGQEGQASWQFEEASSWIICGWMVRQCTKYNLKSYVRECFTLLIVSDSDVTLNNVVTRSCQQFLQNKTKTLALTVVPFAALIALTPPAKASVLSFNPSTPTLTQTAPSGSFNTSNLSSVFLVF